MGARLAERLDAVGVYWNRCYEPWRIDRDRRGHLDVGLLERLGKGIVIKFPADVLDLDGDSDLAEPLPYDLDAQSRFTDVPWKLDQGMGTPPLVDMGAYEYAPNAVYLPLTAGN